MPYSKQQKKFNFSNICDFGLIERKTLKRTIVRRGRERERDGCEKGEVESSNPGGGVKKGGKISFF